MRFKQYSVWNETVQIGSQMNRTYEIIQKVKIDIDSNDCDSQYRNSSGGILIPVWYDKHLLGWQHVSVPNDSFCDAHCIGGSTRSQVVSDYPQS